MAYAAAASVLLSGTDVPARRPSTAHTILSVDDNETNRYIRARALRAAGFDVIDAATGADALRLAAERQPSLVLLDIRLPDIDGFNVCRRLKSDPRTTLTPVIHISALGRFEEDLPQALEHQSDVYLREPIEQQTLIATIAALIRAREAEQRQREAEERARQAERRAAEALESIADPIIAFDRQWRFTYLSRHAAEFFGRTSEALVGMSIWHLFPSAAGVEFRQECERAWSEWKPTVFERYSQTQARWLEIYFYPFENGASLQWRDITPRKRAEAGLREAEARLARTQEFSLVMALHVALDGTWLKLPPTFVRFLGCDSDTELLGRPSKDLTHPDDYSAEWGQVLRLERGEIKSFEMEKRFVRKDGTITWGYINCSIVTDQRGKPVHLLTYVRDINAQKIAEETLRQSEARERARAAELEAIMEAVPIIVLVARDPECRYMFANRTGYEVLRLTPRSNISESAPEGSPLRMFKDGREIPAVELPVQRAASTGQPVHDYEFRVVLADGSYRDLLGDAVPLFGEDGRTRGAAGAFIDITDRKRNEQRLRESQKLESIGRLAGGIAHDFNNLLVGVMGNASLAEGMLPEGHRVRILLDRIVESSERAAGLTRQMLAYAGKGQFVVERVNLTEAVEEAARFVQPSISGSIALHLELDDNLPEVEADRSQIEQIASNLMLNAAEAIGCKQGAISVGTGVQQLTDAYIHRNLENYQAPPGTYVYVSVCDTGSGMDEATRRRMFDPFFTTKFTGRGLGLAAVAGIVRSQNGGIEVKSAPGEGSTFTVWLPAAE